MVKQKSQAEIEAQIKQCRKYVVALNELMKDWTSLNNRTRAAFKGSESKRNDVLKKALEESDGHIAELEKLVGRIRDQISELQK